MSREHRKRGLKDDLWLAAMLVTAGIAISLLSVAGMKARDPQQMAQATQPLQASPPAEKNAPAASKPGGTRPTTPAPEPARPDPQAQKEGAKATLPPAPPEKIAPPIKDK